VTESRIQLSRVSGKRRGLSSQSLENQIKVTYTGNAMCGSLTMKIQVVHRILAQVNQTSMVLLAMTETTLAANEDEKQQQNRIILMQ